MKQLRCQKSNKIQIMSSTYMYFLLPFFSWGNRPCHCVRLQEIPFGIFVPEVVDPLKVDFEAGQVSPAISHWAYPVLVTGF